MRTSRSGFDPKTFRSAVEHNPWTTVTGKLNKGTGMAGGDVLQVRVDPCEKLPCTFKKGRSAKIEMDFHSAYNQSSVSVGIMGKSHGVLLPLPFNQKDGCTSSGLDCPLQAGRNYTVARAVKVYRIYPKMEILAVFQVSGNGGDVLACVEFPIHIM
nr:NPC intracellular cholesterol transporter 2 homolog a-like [Rhipicephalus microplus]